MKERVAILGASPDASRYSYLARESLLKHGHSVVLVNPKYETIQGEPVYRALKDIAGPVDTLTVYVSPERLPAYVPEILALKPRRAIFNPGTESPEVIRQLESAGINCVEACTLVMLRTGQF